MSSQRIYSALNFMNPWWRLTQTQWGLPSYHREGFYSARAILHGSERHEAILLVGPRQSGKTTILRQLAGDLISSGQRKPEEVCMINRDHPDVTETDIDDLLREWQTLAPHDPRREVVLIDEVQYQKQWQLWTKQQVDFNRGRRIVMTGSATGLRSKGVESGVGRWRELSVGLLSFREFLEIRSEATGLPPKLNLLEGLADQDQNFFRSLVPLGDMLMPGFSRFLLRGGFPVSALAETDEQALQTVANDIVKRMLSIDMTAYFGVRKVLEIERLFSYLKNHSGGQIDYAAITSALEIKKTTAVRYLDFLEHAFLISSLKVFGYGKEVLRSRAKIYTNDACLADPISRGNLVMADADILGRLVETTIFKHLRLIASETVMTMGFWRGKKDHEVDFIVERGTDRIPIEVKFTDRALNWKQLPGLIEYCNLQKPRYGIVVTRRSTELGRVDTRSWPLEHDTPMIALPAPIFAILA